MWDFYYGQQTISIAAHIALLDARAEFTAHLIDVKGRAHQSGDYAKLNPKLRVPTLVTPQGVLTETPAILAFIAQSFPERQLAPVEPFAFAKLQEFCSYIASTMHVAHAHKMRGHRWVDPANTVAIEAMQAKVAENMTNLFQLVEDTYAFGPYVFGDQYTIADPYLYTIARWLDSDGVAPGALPKIEAHRAMMDQRDTAQAVLALHPAR